MLKIEGKVTLLDTEREIEEAVISVKVYISV